MNAFEKLIAGVAPTFALKRARARMALGYVSAHEAKRTYEAASKGRRTDGWRTASTSANTEIKISISATRDRARALVRDNGHAAKAVNVIASHVVGYGIKTTPITPNKKNAKTMLAAWRNWAETTACDADGLHDLYGLQDTIARCWAESGEVLIQRVWRPDEGLAIPMQIRVMEPDFLDTGKDGVRLDSGNIVIQGVEFDRKGRRAAYWLFDTHPGDSMAWLRTSYNSKRVPAEDIIHLFRQDRAGQVRGITWFAPVIIRLRDYDEYEDAQIVRQKIAACFAAFEYDGDGSQVEQTNTGGVPRKAPKLPDMLEPGTIQRLGPGKDIKFSTPPAVEGYRDFASITLHEVAAGIGIPYELLTGDYEKFSFSSGRMSMTAFHTLLDSWQWKTFIPRVCGGVFQWFAQAAMLTNLPAQGMTAKHTPPRRTLVDPTREIPAIIKAVRAGIQSMPAAIREMGDEPEEMLDEIEQWNKDVDARGIVLDTDPRKMSGAGQAQAEPAADDTARSESNADA